MTQKPYKALADCDIFSIGHSNLPIGRFVEMLQEQRIGAIADVRSMPKSGRYPWFSRDPLTNRLAKHDIGYIAAAGPLGGRPNDPKLFCDGVADYEAMAATPQFQTALERLVGETQQARLCLMCAEREPLDCHRCLLVGRALSERGLRVGHILHDGSVEPHKATEERLLELSPDPDLFTTDMQAWLSAAYRKRARSVAYRAEPAAPKPRSGQSYGRR
jgi:uncharacterized protein (DUF488 family)